MTKKAIRFTASWCGPCKAYAPMFEKASKENTEWEFETVDIDQNPEIGEKYGVRSIPTTIFEMNDDVIGKTVGILQTSELIKKLKELNEK